MIFYCSSIHQEKHWVQNTTLSNTGIDVTQLWLFFIEFYRKMSVLDILFDYDIIVAGCVFCFEQQASMLYLVQCLGNVEEYNIAELLFLYRHLEIYLSCGLVEFS